MQTYRPLHEVEADYPSDDEPHHAGPPPPGISPAGRGRWPPTQVDPARRKPPVPLPGKPPRYNAAYVPDYDDPVAPAHKRGVPLPGLGAASRRNEASQESPAPVATRRGVPLPGMGHNGGYAPGSRGAEGKDLGDGDDDDVFLDNGYLGDSHPPQRGYQHPQQQQRNNDNNERTPDGLAARVPPEHPEAGFSLPRGRGQGGHGQSYDSSRHGAGGGSGEAVVSSSRHRLYPQSRNTDRGGGGGEGPGTNVSDGDPHIIHIYKHEDLADLEYLDDEILLNQLKTRFSQHQPYTYVGDSLVAVNPCTPLNIYTPEVHTKYQNLPVRSGAPAHIFWTAAQVYRNLITTGSSQCVVVGGDSGAGKTESTKYILQHLVHNGPKSQATRGEDGEPLSPDIVGNLEKVNPLLELFGNASTVLNENSSRFGKLVELEYDDRGTLKTARLECFILEKFRVTSQNPVERNFHIFYALFAGLSEDRLAELGLDATAESFRIIKPWETTEGVFRSEEELQSYAARCSQLSTMMADVGFKQEDIKSLFEILAAILLISNIEFEYCDPDFDDTIVLDSGSEMSLASAMSVLGLEDAEELRQCLLEVNIEVKGERMARQKTLRQAKDGRDALARELYSVLFYGVVDKINRNLHEGTNHKSSPRNPCIRLLDISGFENVASHNGFEQFIINSTNEKLHQFFLQHTFLKELEEYKNEGLPEIEANFTDNKDIVQVIFAKPEGLIPLLEDEIVTNGTDQGWVDRCRGRSQPSSNFSARAHLAFRLTHYAGKVDYTAEGFVTKNSDTLPHNLREVIQRSENTFIRDYFIMGSDAAAALHSAGRASIRKQNSIRTRRPAVTTIGKNPPRTGKLTGRFTDQYLKSLSGMMTKLHTATPVFIRCIKPNATLQTGYFDMQVVRDQLRSSGLLEVTKVRRDGYPLRIKFSHFVKRYKDILDNGDATTPRREDQLRQTCDVILSTVDVTRHRIGHSKVFLKMQHRDKLEDALNKKVKEREEQARKEMERERAAARRGEDDMSSTTTDPVSVHSSSTESGFASGHFNSSLPTAQPGSGKDALINIPEDSQTEEEKKKEEEEEEAKEKEKEKKKKEKKKKEGLGNDPAYNIFRLTERDFENSTELEMKFRRVARFMMYVLIFCLILAGSVVSRTALVWLGSSELQFLEAVDVRPLIDRGADAKAFRAGLVPTRLLLCQLFPVLVAWVAGVLKVLFGRKDFPTFNIIFVVTLLDCAGVVGRSVFLFKVLPETDTLTAIVLGTAVCQVPAVLKMISRFLQGSPTSLADDLKTRRWTRLKHFTYSVFLFFATLVQFGVVPTLYLGDSLLSAVTSAAKPLKLPPLWAMIVAAVGSSVSWWENYAYGRTWRGGGRKPGSAYQDSSGMMLGYLSTWRVELRRVRQTSFLYTGPVQMGLMVALFFAFNHDADIDVMEQLDAMFSSFANSFRDKRVQDSHLAAYSLVYVQIAGTFVSPYFSGLACRLYMQRVGFAAPLLFVVPACIGLTLACTPSDLVRWYDVTNQCITTDVGEAAVLLVLLVGVAAWLSTSIINAHVWFPEVERTAKMERLFAFPHRDPVYPDVCLQCTRRQDQQENAEHKRRHKKTDGKSTEGVERPVVYICATMWHEIRQEMLQLLKSMFRIDFDVYTRKKAMSQFDLLEEHSDLYDPEIHIIFDDAFETDKKTKQRVLNSWVKQFIEVMPEAMGSVAKRNIDLNAPKKIPTPFGGRLEWLLPGGTMMYVHLKDKDRIRHRKRWSQILYLYYLLGFRLMRDYSTVDEVLRAGGYKAKLRRRHRVRKNTSLLNNISPAKVRQADNIFLMTLDGDVDFRPEAVRLLLDRMKKNKQVAAVCGRIHPIGNGPMVWYQKFEYAVGHWLQKAAEHVFGCVLCCPGCFSLFRGSALMDDNVMRMYTTEPTEAVHFIQYEQGEDRWLCTLLLQQGWKIEYCAGADALTFAPETFHDFYIQRRRWSPSTMANIIDLISSWRITVKMNDNISILFMLYQFALMVASILAPGLVVYMIAGSYAAVLRLGLWESYLLSVGPVFLYVMLCLRAKTDTQINVAAIMSAVYAIVMLLVTIGTIINLATASILSPDVMFLVIVAAVFVVAGLIHPNELFCLFHGILYFITVPSTFVFLTVFFLCNLNVVSWGTREGPKKEEPAEANQQNGQQTPVQEKGKLYKMFEKLGFTAFFQDIKVFLHQMVGMKQEAQQQQQQQQQQDNNNNASNNDQQGGQAQNANQGNRSLEGLPKKTPPPVPPKPAPVVEKDHTYWTRDLDIANSKLGELTQEEDKFWVFLLDEYLHPIKANKEQQDKITADLLSARNNVVFGYMLLNLMFTLVLLQLKLQMDKLKDSFYIAGEYEPVSTVSLALFAILLLTQFSGMIGHRWTTFMHLIASTRLKWLLNDEEEERALAAIQEAQKLTSAGAEGDIDITITDPDYSDDEETMDDLMTNGPSTTATPHMSSQDLTAIAEEDEEAPDYSDSDQEEDTDFGGRPASVQYDSVFNKRFQSVRRHIERQTKPVRTPLYQRHPQAPVARSRNARLLERRQSLYLTTQGAPWGGRRNSVFEV